MTQPGLIPRLTNVQPSKPMVELPCLSLKVNEKYESGISSSPYHLKEPVQVHDDKTLQLAQGHHSIELEKRGEINFIGRD